MLTTKGFNRINILLTSLLVAVQPTLALDSSPIGMMSGGTTTNANSSRLISFAGANGMKAINRQTASSDKRLEAIISAGPAKHGKINQAWQRHFENGNQARFEGRLDLAEKHYLQAIRQLKKVNIKDDRLLTTRIKLAETFLQNGKHLDARDTFKLAMRTAKDLGKGNSLAAARTLTGLADVEKHNEKFKKSEDLLKKAISMRKDLSGENTLGVSRDLLHLAELYQHQRLYTNAEPIFELSLDKLNKAENVPELTKASFLDRTGMFFHEQGKMPQASKLFELSLMLKDKYTKLYSPVDARKRGLVHYRCENGIPNAARVFTRGAEVEYLKVKDAIAVATLTPQIYARDWYLLKAEVTIQNQGDKAITACAELPTLTLENKKLNRLSPLDSDAIARELGRRGRRLYSRLLHSADFAYTVNSIGLGGLGTIGMNPLGGWGLWGSVGGWVNVTPDWNARLQARNSAISALGSAYMQGASVLKTKPSPVTLNPGETATFQVFYPYKKFDRSTLRFLVGNAVLEFPFTSKSG